jgi:hypothetical protein
MMRHLSVTRGHGSGMSATKAQKMHEHKPRKFGMFMFMKMKVQGKKHALLTTHKRS